MATNYSSVHIPVGCEVLVGENESSLESLGVLTEDSTELEISYDIKKVQGSRLETVAYWISNEKVKGSFSLYELKLDRISRLAGGIMNITNSQGTFVSGETFTIPVLEKSKVYMIPGQNSSGEKQTLTSVKQGSKTLADITDYVQVRTANGDWGIMVLAASTATSAAVTITYSYTPVAFVKATMGDLNTEITTNVIRFLKIMNGKKFQATIHKAVMTNGIKLSFPPASSDNIPSLPVEIAGELDHTRIKGDQLIEIIDELGV